LVALNTRFCFLPYFANIFLYAKSLSWISVFELSYILTKFTLAEVVRQLPPGPFLTARELRH
jgi:hypothetical protein